MAALSWTALTPDERAELVAAMQVARNAIFTAAMVRMFFPMPVAVDKDARWRA